MSDYIIKPCPKCGSEDISIKGCLWIVVNCNICDHQGTAHSYGTRCDRYDEAIRGWNKECEECEEEEMSSDYMIIGDGIPKEVLLQSFVKIGAKEYISNHTSLTKFSVTNEEDYIWFDINKQGLVKWFSRYGCNCIQSFIDHMEYELELKIVSEHSDAFCYEEDEEEDEEEDKEEEEENNIKTYRKKPATIQALQFTGDNFKECLAFIGDSYDKTLSYPNIITLRGIVSVNAGNFIIRGSLGELSVCQSDIFAMTYEME
jgi:hypothetical protein